MNPTKITSNLSTALLVLGFLLIVLAWSGAASTRYVDAQIPFVVSGGLSGIGLIVCGCTLAAIQELRKQSATIAAKLDQMLAVSHGETSEASPLTDTLPEPRVPAPSTIERDQTVVVKG